MRLSKPWAVWLKGVTTTALVLKAVDFSESSKVATLFTRDWGKISVLAKGARRLRDPFDAGLDLLTVCRIVCIRKRSDSLDLLTEAEVVKRFRSNDIGAYYAGCYVAELLLELTDQGRRQHDRLRSVITELTQDQLSTPLPAQPEHPLRYRILHALHDEACHTGEIWLLRKMQHAAG